MEYSAGQPVVGQDEHFEEIDVEFEVVEFQKASEFPVDEIEAFFGFLKVLFQREILVDMAPKIFVAG